MSRKRKPVDLYKRKGFAWLPPRFVVFGFIFLHLFANKNVNNRGNPACYVSVELQIAFAFVGFAANLQAPVWLDMIY